MADALAHDADPNRERILALARRQLFLRGYQALTMDALAAELGMSKKTLYVHFSSKDEIVEAVIQLFAAEVRALAAAVFEDPELGYAAKFVRFARAMVDRFTRVPPTLFRELQRYAPAVYRHIEELRFNNIPVVFGRIITAGQQAGVVRSTIDPAFATEFWRQAIQGMMHPDTTERLGLRPDEIFAQSVNLFCGGLFTPAGLEDYENVSKI